MRKILTSIVLMILMAISAVGQTIDVVSIEESTTDLQARTNPRRDLNGDLCALISLNRVGSSGYCWSCSPAGEDAYYLDFGGGSITPLNSSGRAYGLSVRCIRE